MVPAARAPARRPARRAATTADYVLSGLRPPVPSHSPRPAGCPCAWRGPGRGSRSPPGGGLMIDLHGPGCRPSRRTSTSWSARSRSLRQGRLGHSGSASPGQPDARHRNTDRIAASRRWADALPGMLVQLQELRGPENGLARRHAGAPAQPSDRTWSRRPATEEPPQRPATAGARRLSRRRTATRSTPPHVARLPAPTGSVCLAEQAGGGRNDSGARRSS